MLRRLLHWFNRYLQRPFGSQQTRSLKGARRHKVVEELPEPSNADLEQLFTQLLLGVHQERGKLWVLNYLQRMESRVPVERWLDWLQMFGEELLTTPAANHLLARRMVQLGELNVGRIGDLAYDLGRRLLMQNLDRESEDNQTQDNEVTTTSEDTLPTSPGQELIRSLGEQLWEYDQPESQEVVIEEDILPTSPGQELIRSLGEQLWEYDQPESLEVVIEVDPLPTSPGQELIRSLGEQLWEYDDSLSENITPTPVIPNAAVEEIFAEDSEELIWHYEEEDAETTTLAGFLPPAEEDSITSLGELSWGHEQGSRTAPSANLVTPKQETSEKTWDNALVNLEPNVAYALDELWVRLDQSANLVQQLATNLAIKTNNTLSIIDRQANQSHPVAPDQACFYQGLQQAKTGDLLGAIASYDQAIELKPNFYEYWFNRGLTLFHLKYYPEAIASYETAIKLKSDLYKAWYYRGGTLGELGNFEEAIASFNKAIEIKPDYYEAWASRGFALLKLGWIREAISSYDQALNLQPEDQENWYYRGIALAVDEQYPEAIASYDKALEIQPDYHEVWIDRGVVLFNLKQWSEAIASWDKALSIQADFYLAWYNRGIALENLGRRQEAIVSYGQAIAIKPDFHLAWYNQAVALFYLEQYTEAIACYDSALQIKQDYWEAWIGRGTAAEHIVNAEIIPSLSTSIAVKTPALQQGGYAGKLASYEEGLKHLRPDTHPEGWGRLHLAIGNTYYEQGKKHSKVRDYWRKAVAEYHQALLTITLDDFALLHLEILQSLVRTLVGLGQTTQVQELQQRGTDLLQQLLNEATRSDESKQQLALKFTSFSQLAVDLAVDSGDLVEAWEFAEQGKNACLNWLLFGWSDEIYSPNYNAVQQLLNSTTAIVYWHISPAALHTFILKDGAPSPILLFTPIQDVGAISSGEDAIRLNELPLPEAVRRLLEFEDWLEDWQQKYQEYYTTAQDKETKSQHSWRVDMEQKLLHLYNILNISTITQELEGINQLILIPHRELHRLPIHTLFNFSSSSQEDLLHIESNFIITYLPSLQTGLSIKSTQIWQWQNQSLLSVEYPESASYPLLNFANIESEIISQMFEHNQRLQGKTATKDIVKNALFNDYNILHFAGYITNNFAEPKKSELVLADEDKLILEEICQKTLVSYNLVTLSNYESLTISNSNHISSEYVGLVSGFLSVGVSHVVSTLWTVDSSASALVMIEFYRRLHPSKSTVIALAEATTWLRELTAGELTQWYEELLNNLNSEDIKVRAYLATQQYRNSKMVSNKKLYNHPYYWAGFTITGKAN